MNTPEWVRIDRVLAGEATAAEIAEIEAWAASAPSHAALLDALRADRTFGKVARPDTDAAWARLRATIEPAAAPSRRPWLHAAVIAFLALAGAALVRILMPVDPVTRTVVAGERPDTVRFADGSTVIVAPGGRLEWADAFASGARAVILDGEALFDVARDAARPFRVAAAPIDVTVVGTRFVVRAWPERSRAEVVVVEGAVRVATARDTLVVTADRSLTFDGSSVHLGRDIDLAADTAWLSGRLAFTDVPLVSVLPRLERRFDVVFVLSDSTIAGRRVTASFASPTAARVLEALALALDLRFERVGRVVNVRPPP